jgi:hypothetical protein
MQIGLRLFLMTILLVILLHLASRVSAQENEQLKQMMCSQAASLEVYKLGMNDHEAEEKYAEIFNRCMEVLKDVPTIHS